jgi:hypothetical protein
MFSSESNFTESQTSVVDFPEEKPEDFKIFLSWLYQGRLTPAELSVATESDGLLIGWKNLWGLHTLAYKFNLVDTMDDSIDDFLGSALEIDWVLDLQLLGEIYASAPSGLRKLSAHSLIFVTTRGSSPAEVDTLGTVLHGDLELLSDLLKIINRRSGSVRDRKKIRGCKFHVHGETSQSWIICSLVFQFPRRSLLLLEEIRHKKTRLTTKAIHL